MSAAAHAYLNTRVSIMATRLLAADRVSGLATQELSELSDRFGLGEVLDAQLPTHAKSRAVEQALIQSLLAEVNVLIRPMNAVETALVLSWARKFALFNLKALIRGKLHHLEPSAIRDHLYDLPPRLRLSNQALFRTENVLELLRELEQGPFSLIARQAREVYEQKREPFALEATIDQRYYAELMRQIMQFQGASLQPLRQLFGAVLDRVNLLWLLRFRLTYQFSPSETFYHLIPSPRLLHRERLLALVNLDSLPQVLEVLPPPLGQLMADADSIIEVQRRAGRHLVTEARQILSQSASGVARALAYLILREMDLATLLTLIQGQLLGLPVELVSAALDQAAPEAVTIH